MLRIKVFQNGSTRIYNTNSFNNKFKGQCEIYNFMREIAEVDVYDRKVISFEDAVTETYVFLFPSTCLIEVDEVADE